MSTVYDVYIYDYVNKCINIVLNRFITLGVNNCTSI